MPTVLLVDVSLSLAHALQSENLDTYKEFMQEGLLYLIQELEANHPLELVSFITFSSKGKVLVPFSRNFSALKTALFNIRLEDKTNVMEGMKTVSSHVISTFGTSLPVQIILVTNGCKLGGEPELLTYDIPFPCKIHVIAYGEKAKVNTELFHSLSWKTKGFFQFLDLPQSAPLLRQAFSSLLENHCLLACGHLQAPITLYPNPSHISSNFPNLISIVGFIPNKRIPSPPIVSRYYVLRPIPPLLVVLHDTLKTERLTAVARIDDQAPKSKEWFCLINSVVAEDSSPSLSSSSSSLSSSSFLSSLSLVFSVLTPQAGAAMGLADLVALPASESLALSSNSSSTSLNSRTHITQMMMVMNGASSGLRPQHPKSYAVAALKDNVLIGITPDALIPDCGKIVRYAKAGKIEMLYMECEKIRQTALTYCCADLLRGIAEMLSEELNMDSSEGTPIADLIKMLPNHSPDTPIVYREKSSYSYPSSSGPPASTQMSIHSLIS